MGAAKLLCYFLSFLLTKVRRSIAVTTPNTICFMKELPLPLTVSTENASLAGKKKKRRNSPLPPRAVQGLLFAYEEKTLIGTAVRSALPQQK